MTAARATRARTVRLDAPRLQRAADLVRRFTGIRVELDVARPAVAASRCGKHAALVGVLDTVLRPLLPAGRTLVQQAGIALPGTGTVAVPDLAVCPTGFLGSDDAFLHPQDVDFAVEVVLRHATLTTGVPAAVDRYAAAGVRALLVVDPRPVTGPATGTWALHTEPVGGHYWATLTGTFGATTSPRPGARTIPLPPPLRGELPLDALPVYAQGRSGP
ncbi:Uma2 family endonuclease [Streptomyces sp. DSM 42041]|uniref:Uma2 family endonuclease n=1 Tax=Streptomyces hazeniae TaxID=3075538 RepID=A0ABU2NPV5_9ACTN|nr:Uma2 family endonuclease [Streptomyces sp. DSM 42041]MDT0378636.1 Uma2 family endonuclease [Streptomyces sp. DSM 42041]